jgi:hypothetical protein
MPTDVTILEIGDDQLDTLFGEVAPEKTFKAEDLTTAQKKEEETPQEKSTKNQKPNNSEKKEETPEVTEINEEDENLLFTTETEETEVEKQSTKKVTKEEKVKEAKSINFKNLVDHFVESGKWVDFEGREDIDEVSEEDFLKISEQQDDFRVNSKFNDVLDKTGDYGKAIIEFEKNGGNPAELLSLFREQRDIQNIDLADQDNQEEVIKAYYEAQGEDEEWIKDYVDSLKDRGDEAFKKDAEKKHAKLLDNNKQEVAQLQVQQKSFQKEQEEAQKYFQTNTRKAIHSKEDWSNSEKKDLEKFLLAYDKKLSDGRIVNSLFLKMTEIQQDPAKYVEFAKFIQDMDKYKEGVKKQAATETVKKQWKLIKDAEGEGYKKASLMPDEIKSKKQDPFSLTFKN